MKNEVSINGSMDLNTSITLNSCKIYAVKQKLYLHKFPENYDILMGRDY